MEPILLRITDVVKLTSLSRSSIYRMIANDEFPRQISIGNRQARWSRAEVENWCQEQIYASQSA
jgi:prophage regulatory protein